MKLKTWKDIEDKYKDSGDINYRDGYEYGLELSRQEAIKHIKALRNGDCEVNGVKDTISVILYFKYIFNITDEEI